MWMRYQYYGMKGITWTKWFKISDDYKRKKYQYKDSRLALLNEYSDVDPNQENN